MTVKPEIFDSPTQRNRNNSSYLRDSLHPSEIDMEVPEEEMYAELKKNADRRKTREILSTDQNPILYVRNLPSTDFYMIL